MYILYERSITMKTIRKHLFKFTVTITIIITIILLLLKLKLNETSCYDIAEETPIIKDEKVSDLSTISVLIKILLEEILSLLFPSLKLVK